ncbi:hypothetical protein Y032_0036g3353 [Ancylostoma ceylanicum]|uniref:C-type lectin domain-containing protein n=1 Tax=Ancylostoma ceylanicum TaxID=53326 RepID=A0A016UMN5_9BILA|nr:hypothetical protein Y032_0036g3353 [Ancylostoma ceylanicum]
MVYRILWICALFTSTLNYPIGYCSCTVHCTPEDLITSTNETFSSLSEPCCTCMVTCEEKVSTLTRMLSAGKLLDPEASGYCCKGEQQDSTSFPSFEEMSSSKVIQHQICPDGWRRYGETCFYVEMERLPFDMAEARCKDKNSTIFVADSLDEWDEIMGFTPPDSWTWIDVKGENGTAQWRGALDASNLNWLIQPFSPAANGWTTTTSCAAYRNMDSPPSSHVFFYPCSSQYRSICKRKIGFHV